MSLSSTIHSLRLEMANFFGTDSKGGYMVSSYIENMAEPVVGTVEKISRIPAPENSGVEAQYAVYVTVSNANSFYYGMNVIVTTGQAE